METLKNDNDNNNALKEYCKMVYNNSHLDPIKKKLIENNYTCYITQEGCLLDDELWIHEDTINAYITNTKNPKYIFVFKSRVLNAWSSTQDMRKKSKLSKADIKFLEKIYVL